MISIHLVGSKDSNNKMRGYWKLNNRLLKDKTFQVSVHLMAQDIFSENEMTNIQKWEYFKFKIREIAIKRSKEIKKVSNAKEKEIMENLNVLFKEKIFQKSRN